MPTQEIGKKQFSKKRPKDEGEDFFFIKKFIGGGRKKVLKFSF